MLYYSQAFDDYVFIDHYENEVIFYDKMKGEFKWSEGVTCSAEMINRLILDFNFKEATESQRRAIEGEGDYSASYAGYM